MNLQEGDKKVTLKHLVQINFDWCRQSMGLVELIYVPTKLGSFYWIKVMIKYTKSPIECLGIRVGLLFLLMGVLFITVFGWC